MKPLRRRSPRGGAAVELAVLMIVLVPTILYTMFLEDLLFYKLDQAEAIVSTPWDFHAMDYRNKGSDAVGWVQHAARLTYADHTSATNSYSDPQYDTEGENHHVAMTAHQCWLASGGEQVTCSIQGTVGLSVDPVFNFMNHGGMATCYAKLGVQNYFLPQDLFGKMFSTVSIGGGKLKEKKWEDNAFHGNAKQDPYVFPEQNFGVVVDPWALNKMDDDEGLLNPDTHPANLGAQFTRWVAIPYGLRKQHLNDANQFADDAIDKEILGSQVKIDGIGDTLLTPPVAWKKDANREFNNHYASGWSDNRQSQTTNKLQNQYMGQPTSYW